MYDKNKIDEIAEREAKALQKQGKCIKQKHIRLQTSNYNVEKFNKLFKD